MRARRWWLRRILRHCEMSFVRKSCFAPKLILKIIKKKKKAFLPCSSRRTRDGGLGEGGGITLTLAALLIKKVDGES